MSVSGESPSAAVSGSCGGGGGEFMLFGVRVKVDPMRKCVSMNNLSEYEPVSNTTNPSDNSGNELPKAAAEGGVAACYASADDAVPQPSNGSRERKRGVPWTEEEHKLFLLGLQKVGKGDWRGISRNYVKTRTPTQVASHAQKYFLRRSNLNRRRRRSSLFDITTDSVTAMPMDEGKKQKDSSTPPAPQLTTMPLPVNSNINGFSVMPYPVTGGPVLLSMQGVNPMENLIQNDRVNNPSALLVQPVPILPMPTSSTMVDLNINQQVPLEPSPLSLRLSLSSGLDQSSRRDSSFQVFSSFKNGDSIISVA
ncbi:UNVERIFIED_CONTAM: Transcription factor R1 [Sesamum angustifolium]|uniref:Transcription factor R1 n=1 Tax=Sesamum angustifolium TaxID=2727405 RepID=A0AAW2Q9Z0_9LAMI